MSVLLLGGIASCSASDFTYCYTFLRSVVCLSVICHIYVPSLNHLTDLDAIWQVHLLGLIAHCVRWRSLTPQGKGRFWGSNLQRKHPVASDLRKKMICDSPGGSIDQQLCLLTNYFGLVLLEAAMLLLLCPNNLTSRTISLPRLFRPMWSPTLKKNSKDPEKPKML